MENNKFEIIKKAGLYLLVVVLLGGTVWGLAKLSDVKGKDNPISGAQTINPVSATAWQRGNLNSKVTLVEYADFQCPACGVYYPLVEQLFKEYGDKVKFEYRHFPLVGIHKNAEIGAVASESAGKQGKFWEMSSLLFENQIEYCEDSYACLKNADALLILTEWNELRKPNFTKIKFFILLMSNH